jgi:methyltransferase-like protein/SAM-dependent methyltransferase
MTETYQPLDYEFDQVPYPHMSHGQTHPNHLAAIGTLLQMNPAPPDQCRVLELGCARGGNLIPMAYTLPNSQFLGIDYSARQIADGLESIQELNLGNILLEKMDIINVPDDFGQFDYIIAHGIYSWVPMPVRDALLRICRDHLAPQGIAYISYNTYPGWHMLDIARELMLFATRKIDDFAAIASHGLEMIEMMVEGIPESHPYYKSYFKTYKESLVEKREVRGSSAEQLILHDELATVNQPVHFHEFAEHASQYELQYLAEASFASVLPNDIPPDTVKKVEELSEDLIEFEQYLDFLKNRSFRRTLLCHSDVEINRRMQPDTLMGLRFASRAAPVSEQVDLSPKVIEAFQGKDGATFKTDHPLSKAALLYLREVRPKSIAFPILMKEASKMVDLDQTSDVEQEKLTLAASILQAFSYSDNLVELHTIDLPFTITVSPKPKASKLARWAAAKGYVVTNYRHERVSLDFLMELILTKLDGKHTQEDILEWLIGRYEEGTLAIEGADKLPIGDDIYRQFLGQNLDNVLTFFSRAAILEA